MSTYSIYVQVCQRGRPKNLEEVFSEISDLNTDALVEDALVQGEVFGIRVVAANAAGSQQFAKFKS